MTAPWQWTLLVVSCGLLGCGGAEAKTKGAKANASDVLSVSSDTSAGRSDARVRQADLARIRGDSTAKVWVVMVSDFQCPFCKIWHDSTSAIIDKEYVATGKVRLAYVNFPLRQHRNAMPAAEAAMCAGAQGKFWEMHNRLFEGQTTWEELPDPIPAFQALASALGLEGAAWRGCMSEHVMRPMIEADVLRGKQADVRSTPSFFIGKEVIAGAEPAPVFREAIDRALAAAASAQGVK